MGSIIRLVAISISAIVLLGFAFFAVDQMDRGSETQQQALESGPDRRLADGELNVDAGSPVSPTPAEESLRERRNSSFRELVDDANDVLLAPFADLIDSDNAWVSHAIPTILALLLYGLGLGMLARMLPKRHDQTANWRAA